MQGIAGRQKCYVEVVSKTDQQGNVVPLQIIWDDGRCFEIDRILDIRQACSLKTGGVGMRYTVKVSNNTTYLFFEGPRWFVEAKIASMP